MRLLETSVLTKEKKERNKKNSVESPERMAN